MNTDQPPKFRFPRFLQKPTLKATEALTSKTLQFCAPWPYRDILKLKPHGGARWLRTTGDLQDGSQQDVQQASHYHIYFLQHRFFLKEKKIMCSGNCGLK